MIDFTKVQQRFFEMSHKIVLRLCFSVLFLRAGTSGVEELTGILGESVTFQVEASPPFETISWTKILSSSTSINIAFASFKEQPCSFLFLHPDFEKRVNISSGCRNLHLGPLKKEDTGKYTAGIVFPSKKTVAESFDLRVFIRLVDSELKVTCTPEGTGNRTWQLNCSTGAWEDRVNISWTSSAQSTGPTPGSSVIQFVSQELNATCTAENPVSQASRTVSLKQVCAEERPGTEAPQVTDIPPTSRAWIVGVIIAIIILLVIIVGVLYAWWRKAAKGSGRFTTQSETENTSRSDSALIGDQPKETRRKTNQPARKAAKNNLGTPQTIYTSVQHPKQNHLQTDDEKMGQHSHQNQAEKTIYSEITKSQEGEDSEIKTIYETVQKPLSVKSSGMSAFV